MVWILVLMYLGVGAAFVCWGATARQIAEERNSSKADTASSQRQHLYIAFLCAAVIVFWPIFLPVAHINEKGQREAGARGRAPIKGFAVPSQDPGRSDGIGGPSPHDEVAGSLPIQMIDALGRSANAPILVGYEGEIEAYISKIKGESGGEVFWVKYGAHYQASTSRLIFPCKIENRRTSDTLFLYFAFDQEWNRSLIRASSVFVDQRSGKIRFSPTFQTKDRCHPRESMSIDSIAEGLTLADGHFASAIGEERYYTMGVLDRVGGPALIEVYSGYAGSERHKSWWRNGILHRDDGPAVVGGRETNGKYEWWVNGQRHRTEGPAVIELYDSLEWGGGPVYEWWRDGVRQKVQLNNGIIIYFKNGKETLTEYPDGSRTNHVTGETQDIDGNSIDEPYLESFDGFVEKFRSMLDLYEEPEATFDKYNPER